MTVILQSFWGAVLFLEDVRLLAFYLSAWEGGRSSLEKMPAAPEVPRGNIVYESSTINAI
jgi:hypothetical protein